MEARIARRDHIGHCGVSRHLTFQGFCRTYNTEYWDLGSPRPKYDLCMLYSVRRRGRVRGRAVTRETRNVRYVCCKANLPSWSCPDTLGRGKKKRARVSSQWGIRYNWSINVCQDRLSTICRLPVELIAMTRVRLVDIVRMWNGKNTVSPNGYPQRIRYRGEQGLELDFTQFTRTLPLDPLFSPFQLFGRQGVFERTGKLCWISRCGYWNPVD